MELHCRYKKVVIDFNFHERGDIEKNFNDPKFINQLKDLCYSFFDHQEWIEEYVPNPVENEENIE